MINEVYPNFFKNYKHISFIKKETVTRADRIICISNKTKEDLINYFSINENKIDVIYLAPGIKKNKLILNTKKNILIIYYLLEVDTGIKTIIIL